MLTLSYHELISEPTSSLTLQSNKIKDVEQIQKENPLFSREILPF